MPDMEFTLAPLASVPAIVQPNGAAPSPESLTGSEKVTSILSGAAAFADSTVGAMPSATGMPERADSGLSGATGKVRYCATVLRCWKEPRAALKSALEDALSSMSPEPEPGSAPTSVPDVS